MVLHFFVIIKKAIIFVEKQVLKKISIFEDIKPHQHTSRLFSPICLSPSPLISQFPFKYQGFNSLINLIRKFQQISLVEGSSYKLIQMKTEALQNQQSMQAIAGPPGQEEENKQQEQAGYCELFRFANRTDYILMIVGTICACAMGTALPSFALLWGNMTNSFGSGGDQMVDASRNVMFNFIEIGVGAVFAGWGMFACWMVTGQRQGIACRKQYLRSLLRQEIGWFDTINQSELSTKFATDSFAFQEAIGEKVSTLIMTIAMFIAGFTIAFIKGWLMTLVTLASLPAIGFGGYLYSTAIAKKDTELQKEYSEAGGMAEQAIAAIKTVKQLNGQQFQSERYAEKLKNVTKNSTRYGIFVGLGIGSLFCFMLSSYGLGFWFGSNCVEDTSSCPASWNGGRKYSTGDVLVIFFSILMAGFNMTQLTPAIKKMSEGRTAAARIFKIIDRQPAIVSPPNALKPASFKGVFRFEKVTFAYPKEPSRPILDNLSLQINSKSTAFVGQSGCGKSTIFQLMMRFYDPDQGRITLDGYDLRELDLYWLRDQIGYVGQEPVLFATTLRENLLFGKEDATQQQIDDALRKAEAYDFVYSLKDKLETFAGTAGSQISGGQKQRLAIARALLKNPKILLLDEATSALDRRNEKNIQATLNKIAEEKTTVTIAHRVKTIMNCDEIYVLEKGSILERGKFRELQRYRGIEMEREEEEAISPEKVKVKPKEGFIDFSANLNTAALPDKENSGQQATKAAVDEEESEQTREKKRAAQLLKKYDQSIFSRLFAYSSHRKGLFAIGIFVCICNGVVFPIFSIFLAKMLSILLDFDKNPSQARKDANLYAIIYVVLGVAAFILCVLRESIFSTIGEEITEKVRNQAYLKILKMPITWLDQPRNSAGSLSARLAADCHTVNGLTTTYVAILIQNIANLLAGIIIAFIYEWRTSLVALGLIPLMIIAGAIQMAFTTGFSAKTDVAYKDSSALITESMINIRTVTSFGYENMILDKYSEKLKLPFEIAVKKGNISGLLYGLSQLIMFVVFALIFFLGAVFIRDNNLPIGDVFTAIYSLMFAGMTAGNNSHFMPDVAAAKNSAANIFQILDSEDEDQLQVKEESKLLKTPIKGHIELKNVSFKYESRNEHVFRNLSLEIRPGWKVGFVGSSGCGKSTIHQLLQRFYDAEEGEILIDGINIRDYDIHHLRGSLGVVSQQPVLFNDTIGNNIQYNLKDVTRQDIVRAANASNFNPQVEKIEDVRAEVEKAKEKDHKDGHGFDKNVGVKGSHISGGQKQRVAIARVVIRKPNVLLLDEATSALDSNNQKKVQDSLDRIMQGKTCINIAHRIDTIRNSNVIMVFEKGMIAEKGTYDELMALKASFYKLERGLEFV